MLCKQSCWCWDGDHRPRDCPKVRSMVARETEQRDTFATTARTCASATASSASAMTTAQQKHKLYLATQVAPIKLSPAPWVAPIARHLHLCLRLQRAPTEKIIKALNCQRALAEIPIRTGPSFDPKRPCLPTDHTSRSRIVTLVMVVRRSGCLYIYHGNNHDGLARQMLPRG